MFQSKVKQNHKNLMKELDDKYDEYIDYIYEMMEYFEQFRNEYTSELSIEYIWDILADEWNDEYSYITLKFGDMRNNNPYIKINSHVKTASLIKEKSCSRW